MSKVLLEYGSIAIGAKEAFSQNWNNSTDFSNEAQIMKGDLIFPKYANPCELYTVPLDGSVKAIDASGNTGVWSGEISNSSGIFENPVVLILEAEELFTSNGISLKFDAPNYIYCTDLNIQWYRDDELLRSENFHPTDVLYFCSAKVEYYNKLIITMNAINMPNSRLRLHSIEFGVNLIFKGDELKNASAVQEIDAITSRIPINTLDFTIDSKKNIEFSFQERQPIKIWFGEDLIMTTFVKKANRKTKTIWNVKTEDYIGLLDNTPFLGGIYENKSVPELIEEIFATAKVPYVLDESFNAETLDGYIPYGTCRNALKLVAFAIGAIVNTSYADVVEIKPLPNGEALKIPLKRIMQGQNFTEESRITGVAMTAHSYVQNDKTLKAYDAKKSGAGDDIFVTFREPLYDLSIVDGEIIESGTNYARINISSNGYLQGYRYDHLITVKKKNNPLITASDSENVISVSNATLISQKNLDKILDLCYNYYDSLGSVSLKIFEKDLKEGLALYGVSLYGLSEYSQDSSDIIMKTKVGDLIECETEYMGILSGRIIKQTFGLNGNFISKNTEMRR